MLGKVSLRFSDRWTNHILTCLPLPDSWPHIGLSLVQGSFMKSCRYRVPGILRLFWEGWNTPLFHKIFHNILMFFQIFFKLSQLRKIIVAYCVSVDSFKSECVSLCSSRGYSWQPAAGPHNGRPWASSTVSRDVHSSSLFDGKPWKIP